MRCFLHESGCSSIASQSCRPYGGVSEHLEVLSRQSIVLIADVGLRTGWKTANSAIPAEPVKIVNTTSGIKAAIAMQEMP
jgi:hypothetical protein